MNLIIDQGNTKVKIALFEQGHLLRKESYDKLTPHRFQVFLNEAHPVRAIISSVTNEKFEEQYKKFLSFPVYKLNHEQPLPFSLNYKTPQTLGLDRLALAAAAVAIYPQHDCLVIDAGTCITYDFIDSLGSYHGGAIAPGLNMRYRSLADYTARLPLVEHELPDDFLGASTIESIRSGVAYGMINEVYGTIQDYTQRFPGVVTVITGGDASLFEGLLKNSIFAAPDFLLHGLNNILEHYAEVL